MVGSPSYPPAPRRSDVSLAVLIGGARSGKSRLAVRLAVESSAPVTFIATGEARDAEMAARIAAHRAERPAEWMTVEEPYELEAAITAADASHTVVVDCLTLWTTNVLARDGDQEVVLNAAAAGARAAAARESLTIATSNEVGLGIVPFEPQSRVYRDLLGSVNRVWVDASTYAGFVVAGRILRLDVVDALALP
jgi:adenosylcobinamide kinase / adenosylcobinamide-phosphate guanylyltransferase